MVDDIKICNFSKKYEQEENICYGQDLVAFYENYGKYGEEVEKDLTLLSQDKFELFQNMFPLWSIKDWNTIPFLDKKEVPPFYDHVESFEVVDENVKLDEDDGELKQDDEIIHTHSVVCFHPYKTKYNDINELRKSLLEWGQKYSDVVKIYIIQDGSWYSENCDLVIIEQVQKHLSVSIYDYYKETSLFSF